MKTIEAYCSACGQDVQLVTTDTPVQGGTSPVHDSELVCLEVGEHCADNHCPLGAVPQIVMAARLVRNGLQTQVQPIVKGRCDACENIVHFVIVSRQHAICEQCGTTAQREMIQLLQ